MGLRFEGVKRLFFLSFNNNANRTIHKGFFRPHTVIKNYNVMIDGANVLINLPKITKEYMKTL